MAAIEKLTKEVKQLSARVAELEGEAVKGKEPVADFDVKLKAPEKRVDDVAYEKDSLQARL